MLVTILCAGFTSAWGETKTLTFVQTSTSAGTLTGAPTGVTATFSNTYGTKDQLTKGNSMTLTLSGWDANTTIKGVTLEVKNNKSSGNGTATVQIGSTTLGTLSINGLGSTYQEKALTITETKTTSDLVITISATANSVYCDKFIISYEEGGSQTETAAAPTFSPAAGTYTSAQNVTLSTTTDEATIYYTTDGTDPTTSSSVYSSAIAVSSTTTIKAMAVKDGLDNSSVASATYTIVNLAHAGTQADPYTVADARTAIDASAGVNNVYATGIVSEIVTAYNSQYGNITYNISTDGLTTSDQLQAYRGKSYNGDEFTSADDIQVGDVVVVYGTLKKYNSTYEFDQNSQLVSLSRKPAATITIVGGTEFNIDRNNGEEELQLTATANSGATVVFTVDTENTTLDAGNYEFEDGLLLVSGNTAGVIIIKANAEAAGDYNAATEVTITVNVLGVKSEPTIVVQNESVEYGSTFVVDDSMIEGGAITVTSSNEAIATVSGLTITPAAVGTTTITVSTAETAEYKAGSETFTLTVTAPEGKTTAAAATETVFEETFANCDGTGGNDGSWSGSIASSTLTADNKGWTFSNGNGADACAKFGSSSKKGSATTPALGKSGDLTLSFRAAAWNGNSEGTTLKLSVSEGTISESSVTLTKGEFNTFTATITDATAATTITFEAANSSNNRFFLDDVVVTTEGASLTATLNATTGYATYCSKYPLDFTNATDYSAWQITNISASNEITFEQVTGSVKGGTGLFLKGENGKTGEITLTSADSDTELTGNKLEGTLAPKYVNAGEYYGLSGQNFVKVNAGTVKAGKAILPANLITEDNGGNAKAFTFVFESADGIKTVEKVSAEQAAEIFNLAGQRLQKAQRGVNIIGGRKVIVK